MRYVIVHYHIFKNAGTTVEDILDRNFGECWARFDGEHRDCVLSNQELVAFLDANPRVVAVSSHQVRYPRPEVPGYIFFDIFFLRDPIDRLYSVYRWFRRIPPSDDPLGEMAKTQTLGGFIRHLVDEYPHYVNDVQVNFLANGGVFLHPPGERDLASAIDIMLRSAVPGIVDCFNMSWIVAQYYLHVVFRKIDCAYLPHNASSEFRKPLEQRLQEVRESCGKELYAQLRTLNTLDYELLKRTRAEVTRRFRLVPNHAERLQELESTLARLREDYAAQLASESAETAAGGISGPAAGAP